ncbi:MAG TPA: hypothetical protein VJU82_11920 [Acidobacteriaceae bacterium]|nr:hypothetical protein [Acidobacteriaceae bacterium]
MKTGDKVGIAALGAYLVGALLLRMLWVWMGFPREWETLVLAIAMCLVGAGFFASFYAAIKGSRWWLMIPLSVIIFIVWFLNSGNIG